MSLMRHYFPGNNTPEGFFSYYRYILGQREANSIICIKGGPGTGKSTFMKKVAEGLATKDENIDYLHCSADPNSIDGIIIKDKKIAFIDGTSPHIIDPITPGAVDSIINFGEFWNEGKIGENKDDIIKYSEESSKWYKIAYDYLAAGKNIYNNMERINNQSIEISEIYKLAADIISREYKRYDISIKGGNFKKFFSSAITPVGTVNYTKSLLENISRIYLINVPVGYGNESFMNIILDGAIYRGFDAEVFYCPIDPRRKIEHIIIPELNLAFTTTNKWHDLEPWEIYDNGESPSKDIVLIDINDYISTYNMEQNAGIQNKLSKIYKMMIDESISCLSRAKENHDIVEKMYIRTMDFGQIDELVDKTVNEIIEKEV